jgi:hypothetical protein
MPSLWAPPPPRATRLHANVATRGKCYQFNQHAHPSLAQGYGIAVGGLSASGYATVEVVVSTSVAMPEGTLIEIPTWWLSAQPTPPPATDAACVMRFVVRGYRAALARHFTLSTPQPTNPFAIRLDGGDDADTTLSIVYHLSDTTVTWTAALMLPNGRCLASYKNPIPIQLTQESIVAFATEVFTTT